MLSASAPCITDYSSGGSLPPEPRRASILRPTHRTTVCYHLQQIGLWSFMKWRALLSLQRKRENSPFWSWNHESFNIVWVVIFNCFPLLPSFWLVLKRDFSWRTRLQYKSGFWGQRSRTWILGTFSCYIRGCSKFFKKDSNTLDDISYHYCNRVFFEEPLNALWFSYNNPLFKKCWV